MISVVSCVLLIQLLTPATYSSSSTLPFRPQVRDIDLKDETGLTPLMQAAQDKNLKKLQALFQNGANPNVQDDFGWTALTHAVSEMDPSIVRFVLEHGADPNIKDNRGMTVLMWASLTGKTEIVQLLIARAVDLNETTKNGATALSLADAKGNKKASQLLKQAGGTGPQVSKSDIPRWLAPIDELPRVSNRPMPSYTEEARRHGVHGIVHLRVLFGADGKVIKTKVTSGLPYGLTELAIKAASRFKAKPAKNNGLPVEYWMHVEVEFRLG